MNCKKNLERLNFVSVTYSAFDQKKMKIDFMRYCLLFFLFAALFTAHSAGAQTPTGQTDYVVKAGDTLYKIGRRFGVEPEKIRSLNELINNDLRPGRHLLIPASPALRFGESLRKNHADSLKIGKYHKVKAGETLYRIGAVYGLSVDSLLIWNGLRGPIVRTGQLIYLEFDRDGEPGAELDPYLISAENLPEDVLRETGMGELIAGSSASLKMALHRSAPAGTLIRLYQEGSGKFVTVKVIGKLPNISANRSVILKITKGAWDKLALVNSRFHLVAIYRK